MVRPKDREKNARATEEKVSLLKSSQIKQHLYLGNEYLANREYLQATEEFEDVLKLHPDHKEAINKLAKAKSFLTSEVSDDTNKAAELPTQESDHAQLVKEGFVQALKYLNSDNYRNAEAEFTRILDNINQLNLENSQLKMVKQIKEVTQKGPEEILSYIRSDKYEEAKKRLWELIQKTATLAKEKEEREKGERLRLLVESYLKKTSEYLNRSEYRNAKAELQKALRLDPENQEANTLLGRLEDIIAITAEIK